MNLLIALGMWLVVSAAFTPLIGYFLSHSEHRAHDRKAKDEFPRSDALDLPHHSQH